MDTKAFLNQTFLDNTLANYLWLIGILLTGLIFKRLISKVLSRLLYKIFKKYASGVAGERFVALLITPFNTLVLLITFYFAFDRLNFPPDWHLAPIEKFGVRMTIYRLFQVSIVLSITWIILRIVDFFALVLLHKAGSTESRSDDQLIPFIKDALKIVLAIFSIFFILGTIFHFNITSLIAGLGIGGLAIALAAKETLENLLGSFTIFFDKPFVVGDYVQIGNINGNVEKIGFRSTRLRTLEKSFVTVPNKKMVDAELDNLSHRMQRRAIFIIGLPFDTQPSQIKKIISQLRSMLLAEQLLDPKESKVNFVSFGSSALEIQIAYYVNTSNSDVYTEVRESINFKIMEIVESEGCKLAYPTSKVFLEPIVTTNPAQS